MDLHQVTPKYERRLRIFMRDGANIADGLGVVKRALGRARNVWLGDCLRSETDTGG